MIFGMINDGSKTYDVGRDGQGQTDGECEVPHIREEGSHTIRINYVQSKFVEVIRDIILIHISSRLSLSLKLKPTQHFSLTGIGPTR